MVRQIKGGKNYYYQFIKDGKRYNGVCDGCTTKRDAEAYEKRMRERVAAFAEQKSVDRLMERRRQEITGRAGIPLAEAFEMSLKKPHRRTATPQVIDTKRSVWRDFVAFMKANNPETTDLAGVTPEAAEEYIAIIRTSGRFEKSVSYQRGKRTICRTAMNSVPSNRTATLYQNTCTEVFNLLARDAGIAENPFAGIVKPPKVEETREAFTPEELRLICENLDTFTRPLFTVALMTALREGDICLLKWTDIDFQTRTISRTMNKTGRRVEIPIADRLLDYLEDCRTVTGDEEYVFPALAQMYRANRTGVSLRVKAFLERIGIKTTRVPAGRTRAVSVKDLHSCRHTFCYLAGMQGIPLAVVQSIVGHMTPEMTRHYSAHATMEDKRRGMAAMPEIITIQPKRSAALIETDADRTKLHQLADTLSIQTIREILKQYGQQ